jgi:hypothetical protein
MSRFGGNATRTPGGVPALSDGVVHNVQDGDQEVYFSGVVLGVTLAAAVWLLTYRVWHVVEYIEYIGGQRHRFHPSERVRVQPWWSVPATVTLMLAGIGISLWLLPGRRGPVRRLADHFANVANPPSREARRS